MAAANPFSNDPYDRLGVSKSDSLDTIEKKGKKLLKEYMSKAQNASSESEKERYKNAFENIEEALEKIRNQKKGAGPNRRILSASASPSSVKLGEETTITVNDDKGNAVEGCSLKINGRRRGRTDVNGTETITPRDTGTIPVNVERDASGGVSYQDTIVELDVEKKETSLQFVDPPDQVSSGDSVTFTVKNNEGIEIRDVKVASPTDSAITDGSGKATLTMTGEREVTVKASRGESPTTEYVDTKTSIKIEPRTVPLSFKSAPTTAAIGESVSFTVVGDGDRIKGAEVSINGDSTITDNRGLAEVTLSSTTPGTRIVEVEKKDEPGVTYTKGQTRLEVIKLDVDLRISLDESNPIVDEMFCITVTDQSNSGVDDVHIAVDGKQKTRTNSSGEAYMMLETGGEVEISASKPDDKRRTYNRCQTTVNVERKPQDLAFQSVPSQVKLGEPIEVNVIDENNQAVSEAVVKTEGGSKDTTARGGNAIVKFIAPGQRKLTAEKPPDKKTRYNPATESVQVELPERALSIVESPETAKLGEDIQIRVKDTHENYISNAQVRTSSNDTATTGPDGWATVTLSDTGVVRIVASVDESEFDDVTSVNVWVDN